MKKVKQFLVFRHSSS